MSPPAPPPWPRWLRTTPPTPDDNAPSREAGTERDALSPVTAASQERGVVAGPAIAKGGSTAFSGTAAYSAIGKGASVRIIQQQPTEPVFPMLLGTPPPPVTAFQPRDALRAEIRRGRAEGAVVAARVLSGSGGVGKTQLAREALREAVDGGVELMLWVTATDFGQVLVQYGQAAAAVAAPGTTGTAVDVEADARRFLNWLTTTNRTWMIVLDDVTDFAAAAPWWPPARPGIGWTIATTRLRGADVTGQGRQVVPVDIYTPVEADTYLRDRLRAARLLHLLDEARHELVEELGNLPLALCYAASYLIAEDVTSSEYLTELRDRAGTLAEVLPTDNEGYADDGARPRNITAALLISLAAATAVDGTGTHRHRGGVWAADLLRLMALLSPDGQPLELWTGGAVLRHLTASTGTRADARAVRQSLRLLHSYGLITDDRRRGHLAIDVHALTARAVRDTTPEPLRAGCAIVSADALLSLIADEGQRDRGPASTFISNAEALIDHAEQHLWLHDQPHRVLPDLAYVLSVQGMFDSAFALWKHLVEASARRYGESHRVTMYCLEELAIAYGRASRHEEALRLHEHVLAEHGKRRGTLHPSTITARANLAIALGHLGRHEEALRLEERVLAELEVFGAPNDSDNIAARANLAFTYSQLGRQQVARELQEGVLADSEALLGPNDTASIVARANLALIYGRLGHHEEALRLEGHVLAQREALFGPHHSSTTDARVNLAFTNGHLGRHEEARQLNERVLAEREVQLGPLHRDTVRSRVNLAVSYGRLGRRAEAIALQERVFEDRHTLLGPDHPDTVSAGLVLGHSRAGRFDDAVQVQERAITEYVRRVQLHHPGAVNATTEFDAPRSLVRSELFVAVNANYPVRHIGPQN